jgi:sugar transferase (PEP-CTERM system associated)
MIRFFSLYVPIRNAVYVAVEILVVLLFFTVQIQMTSAASDYSLGQFLVIPAIFLLCFYYAGTFGIKMNLSKRALLTNNIQAVAISFAVLLVLYTVLPANVMTREAFIPTLLLLPAILLGTRIGYRKLLEIGNLNQHILLLGSGNMASLIEKEINNKFWLGYRVTAQIPESATTVKDRIYDWVRENPGGKIVVAMTERRGQFPLQPLLQLKVRGVEVQDGVVFYERLMGKILVEPLKPGWLVFNDGFRRPAVVRFAKRAIDCVMSCVGLILSIPFFIVIPALITLDSKGPVFLRQKRVGEGGKEFWLLKFRSMRVDAESTTGPIWAEESDSRVTRVGRVIRKLRIDEIPQMINVLRGEMSFVGPRPERPVFVDQLRENIAFYDLRHSVKPGITGWAQVRYRYGATEEDAIEKLQYDLYYIKHLSIPLDFMIILETVQVVFSCRGAR